MTNHADHTEQGAQGDSPLEQVTGEKDEHPEEEQAKESREGEAGGQDAGGGGEGALP